MRLVLPAEALSLRGAALLEAVALDAALRIIGVACRQDKAGGAGCASRRLPAVMAYGPNGGGCCSRALVFTSTTG
jgi:hypothetical protein